MNFTSFHDLKVLKTWVTLLGHFENLDAFPEILLDLWKPCNIFLFRVLSHLGTHWMNCGNLSIQLLCHLLVETPLKFQQRSLWTAFLFGEGLNPPQPSPSSPLGKRSLKGNMALLRLDLDSILLCEVLYISKWSFQGASKSSLPFCLATRNRFQDHFFRVTRRYFR